MFTRQIIGNLYLKWIFFILFALLGEIMVIKAHYNAQQYSTNLLPTLTRPNVYSRHMLPQHHYHNQHHYHHHQHPLHNYHRLQKQQTATQNLKQQPYLTLPFYKKNNNNYNVNLYKKPSSFNYDNMIIYNNKRYKRYPPYQATMPEIPIKKAIGRYLPYTPLYQMNLIHAVTPSILIPLYMHPSKTSSSSAAAVTASRLILKPTQSKIMKPTIPAAIINNNNNNNIENNIIPTTDFNNQLFYNYLRLFKINDKNNIYHYNNTIATTKYTIPPTSPLTSFWHNLYKPNTTTAPSTTSTASPIPTIMYGHYHVESKIKFLDSPFSASNVRQQREDEDDEFHTRNSNSNMATKFRFPINQDITSIATTTRATSTPYQTTTTIATNNGKIQQDQQQHSKKYARTEETRNENQYNFVPTWYPYAKPEQQHKQSNFFTIEDAITPYKPIEPIMNFHSYQPFSYDSDQSEHSISIHTGFSPLQDIYHNSYSIKPLPSFRTTTTQSPATSTTNPITTTTTSSMGLNKMRKRNEIEALTTSSWLDLDLITSSTTTAPTMTTKINTKLHMTTGEEGIREESSKNMRNRLRSSSSNKKSHLKSMTTQKPKKSNYSFFDDWFSSVTESPVESSNFDIITTTIIPTTTIRKTKTTTADEDVQLKLPKYNMKIRRTHKINATKNLATTQASITATKGSATLMNEDSTGEAGAVVKKLRKKYTTYKNNRQQQQKQTLKKSVNLNSTTTAATKTLKDNKKIYKRIKKVIRLRSTLMPILKLKNNSMNKTWQKSLVAEEQEEETEIKSTISAATKNAKEITFTTTPATAILLPTTSSTTTTKTTSTTTTSSPYTVGNEKSRNGNRKRGRYTFNNQHPQQQQELLSIDNNNSKRRNVNQEMNMSNNNHYKNNNKMRNNNSRRSSHAHSGTTISTTTTTMKPIVGPSTTTTWPISLAYENIYQWPASTAESAIMKIANNAYNLNGSNTKHKKINSILHNLQIAPTSSTQQLVSEAGVTEFPPLPIELYFQEMKKTSYE